MQPNLNPEPENETCLNAWQRHKFFVLIVIVLVISSVMVVVAMQLYNSSGAAQVDLSRPGYKSVQSEASRDTVDDSFPSSGKLDASAFEAFNLSFGKHSDQVSKSKSFESSATDTETLQLFVSPSN